MSKSVRHIRKSIVFLYSGFAIVAFLSLFFVERQIHYDVTEATYGDLRQSAMVSEKILKEELQQYRQLIQILHDTPSMTALLHADLSSADLKVDSPSNISQIKDDIKTTFAAMMKRNAHILQLRVIGLENDGMEIIRVGRNQGFVAPTPDSQLQSKGQEIYFREINELRNHQIYISYINLNREHGKIVLPHTPTIRLAIPLFRATNNERLGFIIANVDADYIVKQVNSAVRARLELMLFDEDGYFIFHPNEKYEFSRDLDTNFTFQGQYQFVQEDGKDFPGMEIYQNVDTGDKIHTLLTPIYTGNNYDQGHNYLQILLSQSESVFNDEINERRSTALLLIVVALMLMLLMLVLFLKFMRSNLKLASTRSEFEAIVNSTSEAIIGINNLGVITSWNYSARRMFDIAQSDALDRTLNELEIIDHDVMPYIDAVLKDSFVSVKECKASSKSLHQFPVSVSFSAVRRDTKSPIGVALIIRDISAEKQAQQEIQQVHQNLERQVKERTAELAIAHEEALKSSDLKSAFISNVSHEMRTPLNGILGFVHLLKQEPLSDNQNRYLKMMQTSASSLMSLINDVLDVSKIEAGKLDFHDVDFNLVIELESIADSLVVKAEDKGLILDLDLSGIRHINVNGDANRLKQIVINLMTNAIKFTQSGYVSLRGTTHRQENGNISFLCEVKDTGIGIAQENQGKLFKAFTQEDGKTASQFGGTGLGLSICKQLTQLMGGGITFKSEKDIGSTFSFDVCFNAPTTNTAPLLSSFDKLSFLICCEGDWPKQSLHNYVEYFGGHAIHVDEFQNLGSRPHIDVVVIDYRVRGSEKYKPYETLTNPDSSRVKSIVIKSVRALPVFDNQACDIITSEYKKY